MLMEDTESFLTRAYEHIMETYDHDGLTRPPELVETERQMHDGFSSWSLDHGARFPRMGQLSYRPDIYKDQRIDRPYRPISAAARIIAGAERSENPAAKLSRPALYLGRLAYLKAIKEAHAQTVRSKELSRLMIAGFLETPAHTSTGNPPSLTEYAINCLEAETDMTLGLTSAHLNELADIAEFASALNISIAELEGFKYIDRLNTLINKNMTRQTYKVGAIALPIPYLASAGTGIYWGVPPGESAQKHGLDDKLLFEANKQMSKAFIKHKKERSMIIAYVPTGSGAQQVVNPQTNKIEKVILKDASYTSPISVRCGGGIIPANRVGDSVIFGPVIPNQCPPQISKKAYEKLLTDNIMDTHAAQTEALLRVPASYTRLFNKADLPPGSPEV